ncbi:hypothetical protein BC567DRAFT_232397 [Phyllosticta citribraziliensis]
MPAGHEPPPRQQERQHNRTNTSRKNQPGSWRPCNDNRPAENELGRYQYNQPPPLSSLQHGNLQHYSLEQQSMDACGTLKKHWSQNRALRPRSGCQKS